MKITAFVFCLFLLRFAHSQSINDIEERLKTRLSTKNHWHNVVMMEGMSIEGDNGMTWRNTSDTFFIEIEFENDGASNLGIKVLLKPNTNQETLVGYNLANEQLYINSTNAGKMNAGNLLGLFVSPMTIERGRIKLQIFVDRNSIEVFGNDGKASVISQILPKENSIDWQIFSNGRAKVSKLNVFEKKD